MLSAKYGFGASKAQFPDPSSVRSLDLLRRTHIQAQMVRIFTLYLTYIQYGPKQSSNSVLERSISHRKRKMNGYCVPFCSIGFLSIHTTHPTATFLSLLLSFLHSIQYRRVLFVSTQGKSIYNCCSKPDMWRGSFLHRA